MKPFFLIYLTCILTIHSSCAQQSATPFLIISENSVSAIKEVSHNVKPYVYTSAIDLSVLEVKRKKQAFINMMLPTILIAKYELEEIRNKVIKLQQKKELNQVEQGLLDDLYKTYKCQSFDELKSRLQTHPTSIVIAQAAIESGWGTSRFYNKANNIFGVWSYNTNEPRIVASENREGKAIYVKKYEALPESIHSYFKTIARGPYLDFRKARQKTTDVYELIPHLKVYSELREEYVNRLEELIRYNKLEQYDQFVLSIDN